jgi:hypothetical protein
MMASAVLNRTTHTLQKKIKVEEQINWGHVMYCMNQLIIN